MKNIQQLAHYLHPKKKNTSKALLRGTSLLLIVAYSNLILGCRFYKVNTIEPLSHAAIIEQVKNMEKYIIVHHGEIVWHLAGINLNESSNVIEGFVEPLPVSHSYYKTAREEGRSNQYKKVEKKDNPVYEVHIYVTDLTKGANSQVNIPFSSINKVQVYDRHVGALVFSIVGLTALGIGLVAIIVAATKSSCPFVYASNGTSYQFTGEMYGGAIYPSLERDDYMPLPEIKPTSGCYNLKIANELLERQYTNLANLTIVEHPENTKVILDKYGDIQTITAPRLPYEAISSTGVNHNNHVQLKDSSAFLFNEDAEDGKDLSSLTLSFKRPKNSQAGKLILNAKNSYWLDYAYGRFNEQFGTYYNTFAEKQKKSPSKNLKQWSLDQNIPLSVYLKTENGWQFVDYFNSIGPLATRDVAMAIDLSTIKGEDVIVKLECGFMFWEVDYAAMDFIENIPTKVSRITSTSAIDEKGVDVSSLIRSTDNKYLIQPEIGNVASLEYAATSPQAGNIQTVFLHSRGYYEYIRDYKNSPNIIKLHSFKSKGAFTRFAKDQYKEFSGVKDLFSAALTQSSIQQ